MRAVGDLKLMGVPLEMSSSSLQLIVDDFKLFVSSI